MAYDELLDFWFSERIRPRWFDSTPALDDEIRQRYDALFERALAGELDDWRATPDGALALIIVFDQLPLNMYRGQPRSFAGEALAIEVAKMAIARGDDQTIAKDRLLFLFLPLMHSENLEDQLRSVALFRASGLDHRWAEHHRDLIRRYGRFPHRNAILGRENTKAELEYLASPAAFQG
jgi:uncharacterized protein (DUF924 family)